MLYNQQECYIISIRRTNIKNNNNNNDTTASNLHYHVELIAPHATINNCLSNKSNQVHLPSQWIWSKWNVYNCLTLIITNDPMLTHLESDHLIWQKLRHIRRQITAIKFGIIHIMIYMWYFVNTKWMYACCNS